MADPGLSPNVAAGILINQVLNILLAITIPLATVGIIAIAFQMVTANGKPDAMVKLKKYMGYLVVGIVLVVGALVFLRTFIRAALG